MLRFSQGPSGQYRQEFTDHMDITEDSPLSEALSSQKYGIVEGTSPIQAILEIAGRPVAFQCLEKEPFAGTSKCQVYRAQNVQTGEIVAVKILFDAKEQFEDFENEVSSLDYLQELRGSYASKDTLIIASQFKPGLDMSDYISHEIQSGTSFFDILKVAQNAFAALEHFHVTFVALHRDIKPQNMKVNAQNGVDLFDYDCMTRNLETMSDCTVGTACYNAPELGDINSPNAPYSTKTDLYAMAKSVKELFEQYQIKNRKETLRHYKEIFNQIISFIDVQCLNSNPGLRLGSAEACKAFYDLTQSWLVCTYIKDQLASMDLKPNLKEALAAQDFMNSARPCKFEEVISFVKEADLSDESVDVISAFESLRCLCDNPYEFQGIVITNAQPSNASKSKVGLF